MDRRQPDATSVGFELPTLASRREGSPAPDYKLHRSADESVIPAKDGANPPAYSYSPPNRPNWYGARTDRVVTSSSPVRELPTVSDIHRQLLPAQHQPQFLGQQGRDLVLDPVPAPSAPRYGERWIGPDLPVRPPRQRCCLSIPRLWILVIGVLFGVAAIGLGIATAINSHTSTCVPLEILNDKNLKCGTDWDYGDEEESIPFATSSSGPKCGGGQSMTRIGNATFVEVLGTQLIPWKGWTYPGDFGDEILACASWGGEWRCKQVRCRSEDCEAFKDICDRDGQDLKQDDEEGYEDDGVGREAWDWGNSD